MLVYGEPQRLRDNGMSVNDGRSIGTYNWDPVVESEYPEAFQEALLKVLDPKKTFKYVYLGGAFTESDQEKTLWFYSKGRRVRVRSFLVPFNAFYSPSSGMLTLIRGSPRQDSLTLESRTRM